MKKPVIYAYMSNAFLNKYKIKILSYKNTFYPSFIGSIKNILEVHEIVMLITSQIQ